MPKDKSVDKIMSIFTFDMLGAEKQFRETTKKLGGMPAVDYRHIFNKAKSDISSLLCGELKKHKRFMSMGLEKDIKKHNELVDECISTVKKVFEVKE